MDIGLHRVARDRQNRTSFNDQFAIEPEPFGELTAIFADEAEARRWETSWPALQRKLRTNPYVVLGGLAPLVARLTSTRDGSVVVLRLTASVDETVRLLQVAASALPS